MASISSWFSHDMAIDLGTANTVVYVKGSGVVCNEPSMVAVENGTNGTQRIFAIGSEAKKIMGRTPASVTVLRPLRGGVISNFDVTEQMLRYFMRKIHRRRHFVRPMIVICVPLGITDAEKRAVRETAASAGARKVHMIEEPIAAALGAGLEINEPTASAILNIGGGTSEVAVLSLGGVVFSRSIRVAGDKMDDAVAENLKNRRGIVVGERTAELVKIMIGSAYPDDKTRSMEVHGRDALTGNPKSVEVSEVEIREALAEPVRQIVESVKFALQSMPPELSSDLVEKGITMTGGGALLRGLDVLIHRQTGLPVHIAENPLMSVVMGAAKALDALS